MEFRINVYSSTPSDRAVYYDYSVIYSKTMFSNQKIKQMKKILGSVFIIEKYKPWITIM